MISTDAIMTKVNQWAASPTGRRVMKDTIKAHQKSGEPLASGQTLAGEKEMREAAAALIEIIKGLLPQSIASVGDSLSSTAPKERASGEFECFIQFGSGALRRESLYNEHGYTGEGIDNIVALFNNGYRASKYVYGWWDEHSPTADALSRSLPGDSFAWVKSRKEREALHFMQEAVKKFNSIYEAKYSITATLGGAYTK